MKKLLSCVAIVLSCYTIQAQSLTINNNVQGDVYFNVYTVSPSTCTALPEYVQVIVPAYTAVFVDLTDPLNWFMGTIPSSFDLSYAEVSRDPSCPGTSGWGAFVGPCTYGNSYWDVVTVGNTTCGYPPQDCIEVSISGSGCNGFSAGDVVGVQYSTAGTNVTIDIVP
jgi:hypothetical protein